MTVERMLADLPARELTEWMVYFDRYHLHDDPEYRADLRTATLEATIINTRHGRRGPRAKAEDLLPKFVREAAETAGERLYRVFGEMSGGRRNKPSTETEAATNGNTPGDAGRTRARSEQVRRRAR